MTQMLDTINCSVCGHEAQRDHNLDTNEITIACDRCGFCAETEIVTDTTGRKFWLETLRFPIDEGGRVLRGPRVGQLSDVPAGGN
jgi:DNA-directed RNA polymerase subunit RPC12/RpoP